MKRPALVQYFSILFPSTFNVSHHHLGFLCSPKSSLRGGVVCSKQRSGNVLTKMGGGDLFTLRNGVVIPAVGLGTWQLKDEECRRAVKHALSCGYRLIDTAAAYFNEEVVGDAIRSWAKENPSVATDVSRLTTGSDVGVFVTSKVTPKDMGYDNVYNACMTSLKKLGQRQIDLYLLHWPGSSSVASDSDMNRKIRHDSWKAMEKLLKEGHVRAIGVSNYLVRHLDELVEDGVEVVPHLNQLELHPLCFYPELEKWAADNSMQLQAYSSLGIGNSMLLENPQVLEIAKQLNRTPAQVLLRWGLQHKYGVLPKSRTLDRVESNFRLFDFALDANHMKQMDDMNNSTHFAWDPRNIR